MNLIKDIEANSLLKLYTYDKFNVNCKPGESILIEAFKRIPIMEIRIEDEISSPKLFQALVNHLGMNNKLRDLDIKVNTDDQNFEILSALAHNFMIKTVRIISKAQVESKTEELALKFRKKRIGVEISLNGKNPLLKPITKKQCEVYYPE